MGKKAKVFTVYYRVADLITERERWEATELAASNKRLYTLLADCYKLAEEISKSRSLQQELTEVAKAMKVIFNDGQPVLTKVVKLVFGAERRRASTYSLAIRAAKSRGIKPVGLVKWLEQIGGVEEARMEASGGESAKQKRQRRVKAGTAVVDATKSITTIKKVADTPSAAGLYLMLVETDGKGSTAVKCFIENQRLVKEALALVGKSREKKGEVDNEKQKQRAIKNAAKAA